jgi:hopanoid biosynthesis associated protein HpnK
MNQVPEAAAARRLIVTADDFGADMAVNEAVERAHVTGILSAASLMIGAPAATDAIARARRLGGLRVGLHVTLVDGRPLLPRRLIPGLVDTAGNFDQRMFRNGVRFVTSKRLRRQLRAEVEAQFEAFAASGLALDHVDTHKHYHMHPTLLDIILDVGSGYGMRSMRVPAEPWGFGRRAAGDRMAMLGNAACRPLLWAMQRRLRGSGMFHTDRVLGLSVSGAFNERRMALAIATLTTGTTEVYLHPSMQRNDELQALRSPDIGRLVRKLGIRLGGYSDFAPVKAA